jgi:DNA modification methylase
MSKRQPDRVVLDSGHVRQYKKGPRMAKASHLNEKLFEPAARQEAGASRSVIAAKRRANDLSGAEWTRNSISVWSDIRKTPQEEALHHPALFPEMLVRRLIESFTTREETTILDPFMGSGSTLVAAHDLGRKGIGLEIYPQFIELARSRFKQHRLELAGQRVPEPEIHQADARRLADYVKTTVDLCITSPPYWDILEQKRTADYKEIRRYGEHEKDLGRIHEYEQFLAELDKVWAGVHKVLKPGGYLIVVVMDLRKGDRFFAYHIDLTRHITGIGTPPFFLDDIIIWNRQAEYNNLRSLGYPYKFRINKVHEFILIFQKPQASSGASRAG